MIIFALKYDVKKHIWKKTNFNIFFYFLGGHDKLVVECNAEMSKNECSAATETDLCKMIF